MVLQVFVRFSGIVLGETLLPKLRSSFCRCSELIGGLVWSLIDWFWRVLTAWLALFCVNIGLYFIILVYSVPVGGFCLCCLFLLTDKQKLSETDNLDLQDLCLSTEFQWTIPLLDKLLN